MHFPLESMGMQCGSLALPARSCWESLSHPSEFSTSSQGLSARGLPPPRTCPWPVQHPEWQIVAGPGPGCPHACTPCSWWCHRWGKPGFRAGAVDGSIPVEPGPAGSRTRRGSVTRAVVPGNERLVLVCKSTELFFSWQCLPAAVRRSQQALHTPLY